MKRLSKVYRRLWPMCVFMIALMNVALTLAGENDLAGHWPLAGDVRDTAASENHGRNHHVKLTEKGPRGRASRAAGFDGRTSYVAVPHRRSLDLGSKPFSIALWVHTAKQLDDTLGDLVSKYDPVTRTGFNFSIQNYAGVTASQSNDRHLHFGIDQGTTPGKWTDHGRLGDAVLIYGMAVYDGQLFAGTCEAGEDRAGHVFRYDGRKWTDCGSPDRANAVSSLAVYEGQLYVAASKYRLAGSALAESENSHLGGKVYRYESDGNWTYCGQLPEVEAINGMVVYRGKLYAGSMYAPAGFFRYEGGTSWLACGTPDGKRVESLTVHNGHIFATGYDEGAVYRYDGRAWQHWGYVPGARQTYGFATHRGALYVSEWPHAKVFRLGADKQWLPAGRLGEEKETMPLMVYNGKLYAGTLPSAEVYRYDTPDWIKVARLDLTPEVRYRRVWSMAVYQGRLFAGTLPSGHVHSVEIGHNVSCDRALPAGWVHLAAVRDTDRLKLYINGRLAASSRKIAAAYDLSNDKPLEIGFGAHDYFNGKLSDVRLYRRALAASEIAQLAEAREPPRPQ